MAHFAQLDENNTVINVVVVGNENLIDENGNESEQLGIDFCKELIPGNFKWVQTSYNHNIRGPYAGIGFVYDESIDKFIPSQPYPSWIWNDSDYEWQPPVPMPDPEGHVGYNYAWNEEEGKWDFIEVDVSKIPSHPAELYPDLYPDGIPTVEPGSN